METQNSTTGSIARWVRESVMVKIIVIGGLSLVLMIPAVAIMALIEERQDRMNEAVTEVSQKWADTQYVAGPVLVLPFKKTVIVKADAAQKTEDKVETYVAEAFFLPAALNIGSRIEPEILSRGIYDVVVYRSTVALNGHFEKPNLAALGIRAEDVYWDKAYLVNGVNDLRGIGEDPKIRFNNINYRSETAALRQENSLFRKNFSARVKITEEDSSLSFSVSFPLKGSSKLFFYPLGGTTRVDAGGAWANPKFDGFYLPEERNVNDSFTASWKVLSFNRPFPQQWTSTPANLESSAFGVELLMPVDQYQKSTRSVKYCILIVLLTFVSLLLIELIVKKNIHPFQYIMIGAALVIYYTLLVSFSEHIGFNLAYFLSSAIIILLIGLYSISMFRNTKVTLLFSSLLAVLYTYIFIIIEQQDYALLLGSLGLLISIATLMYVSRNIDWYNLRGAGGDQG